MWTCTGQVNISLFAFLCPHGKAKAPILLSPGCSWTSAWLHPALGDASSWFQALPSLFPIPISGAAVGPGCLDPPCWATSSPFEVSPRKRPKKKIHRGDQITDFGPPLLRFTDKCFRAGLLASLGSSPSTARPRAPSLRNLTGKFRLSKLEPGQHVRTLPKSPRGPSPG